MGSEKCLRWAYVGLINYKYLASLIWLFFFGFVFLDFVSECILDKTICFIRFRHCSMCVFVYIEPHRFIY